MDSVEGPATSKGMLWTGRILSGLVVTFMLFAASFGVIRPEESRKGFRDMGYQDSVATPVMIAMIASVLIYAIPRTSVFGAILLTGYLGGAIATHVRLVQSAFVFPLLVAIIAWVGIYLRDARLRAILPLRT